ncbi:TraR/DksA family transcriptional regulator (plasmid) [Pseudomonas mandelii]|uniref:TraR/DksA family transcriptional regulator n=1 Tax=Pseudomonas mandelii TaxID=75612 RepID=UPI00398CD4A6
MTREELLASGDENYMSENQLGFFRTLLCSLLEECNERVSSGLLALSALDKPADDVDLASVEEDRQKLLRMLDRDRMNLPKLRKALERIDDGSFGYCEESGEPIGIPRLLARPATTLCIEAKHRQEMREKHLRVA